MPVMWISSSGMNPKSVERRRALRAVADVHEEREEGGEQDRR